MANVNKVFLIGNVTRDPVLRHTPNGSAVTELGIATNRQYMTKEGERREEVTFIDVTVWNRQAETCCEYLKKGQPVHVEGFLKMDSWEDKATGEKRSKLKVEADRVQFLGSRRGEDGGMPGGDEYDAPASAPAREPRRPSPANGSGPAARFNNPSPPPRRPAPSPEPDADDDIPF